MICITLILVSTFLTAQSRQDYYVVVETGIDLGTIQKIVNSDETITITSSISSFSDFINAKDVYHFAKAFPGAISPRLQRIYRMTLAEDEIFVDFLQNEEVAEIKKLGDLELLGHYPNDYIEVILENLPNTELDLIKAPLAWTITQGDPNVLVGLADTRIDFNHEDLQGQIAGHIDLYPFSMHHGTGVASLIAAKTNNSTGMASIGYNTRLVVASCNPYSLGSFLDGIWLLSLEPNVKVINCSIASLMYDSDTEKMFEEIADKGILVVASAGNENSQLYRYPAAYDSTLSVTSVGNRYPIGYHHNYTQDLWTWSWKDCHDFRPDSSPGYSNTHNDKVDVCAPALGIVSAWDDYAAFPSGYRLQTNNTSSAAPIVSGLAGLIYSINPNFTAQQVKDIIRDTADDIYHIPYNQQYIGQLGTGRINAFRAVKTADCMVNPTPGLDLAMQNSNLDDFVEPDVNTEIQWQSDDIWVRNQDDGNLIETHQNPLYNALSPNYVYVRVTNNSCETSSGTDDLKLYWAKASTALYWPDHWNGTLYMPDPTDPTPVLAGDEIGTLDIPVLSPGESKILEFQWAVPNPQDYVGINPNPWHFCLLARIDTPNDPMTYPEGIIITENVKNNNNLAWKNTTIIEMVPTATSQIGGVVAVGNPYASNHTFNLQFKKDGNELGKPIYQEAEVSLEMDNILYDAWVRGGNSATYVDSTNIPNKKIVVTNNASLNNIQMYPNEIGTLNVSFNFLTNQLTAKNNYTYHVIQRDASSNAVIGGETYKVSKKSRPVFTADAGTDEAIDRSESVTITAAQINEAAVYNWYDPDGNLIYTGTDLTVSPSVTQSYKLEIITDTDGYKDYDEVEVTVNPYRIISMAPNPVSSLLTIDYMADGVTSAYIMVLNQNTSISDNYILDTTLDQVTLDLTNHPTGLYTIFLVCDGEIQDSKNLARQ